MRGLSERAEAEAYINQLHSFLLAETHRVTESQGSGVQSPEALRSLSSLCQEALRWLDAEKHFPQLCEKVAPLYAFIQILNEQNVLLLSARAGDAAGEQAALASAWPALQRPGLAEVCSSFGAPDLMHDLLIRYGESLQNRGSYEAALAPMQLAVSVAQQSGDILSEAVAQGALGAVYLVIGTSDALLLADEAGSLEVSLLARAGGGPMELARARASLGNVKMAQARSAKERRDAAATARFASQTRALAEQTLQACQAAPRSNEWLGVAVGAHTLRGHLAVLENNPRGAVPHYQAAVDISRKISVEQAFHLSPTVSPLGLLERLLSDLARESREAGDLAQGAADGAEAVKWRRAFYAALGQPMPSECAVCMEKLASNDPSVDVGTLRCTHAFHFGCITSWLGGKACKGTCPMCRQWTVDAREVDVEATRQFREHQ